MIIKTWSERCEEHPNHQSGMVTHAMVQSRMQEEIDELRATCKDHGEIQAALCVQLTECQKERDEKDLQVTKLYQKWDSDRETLNAYRNKVIDECADVCDELKVSHCKDTGGCENDCDFVYAFDTCSEEIRALKTKGESK